MTSHQWIDALQGGEGISGGVTPLPASWECDLADDSLRWSPGVFDLFGLPRDAPLVRSVTADMYVGESRAELDRLRAQAIADRGSFTFDAQIRRPDGTLRWIRLTADVLCQGGRAVRLYGTKQDVTDEVEDR